MTDTPQPNIDELADALADKANRTGDLMRAAAVSYVRHFGARAVEAAEGDDLGRCIKTLRDMVATLESKADDGKHWANCAIMQLDGTYLIAKALLAKTEPTP